MASLLLLLLAAGNVSDIADKMVATASIARAVGFDIGSDTSLESANVPNDQKFADIIVTALEQADVAPEVQASAFTQALTQSLAHDEAEAPDVIIIAAIAANQVNSISQAFASPQV